MKKILQKFSPEISSDLVGDSLEDIPSPIRKAQKVFDLHGYFESEISGKIDFIWEFSHSKHYSRIKIVTGKGKQILFSEVKRILIKKHQKKLLSHFEYDEGSFDVWL